MGRFLALLVLAVDPVRPCGENLCVGEAGRPTVVSGGVTLYGSTNGQVSLVKPATATALTLKGAQSTSSSAADVVLGSSNTRRDAGIVVVHNGVREVFSIDADGQCTPASATRGGCLSWTPGSTQEINGYKVFLQHASFDDQLVYTPALAASADFHYGIATGGPIFGNLATKGISLVGRRRDGIAQVVATGDAWYDGGVIFGVNLPGCGFSGPQMLAVTNEGVYFGGDADRTCSGTGSLYNGALVDQNLVAGHYSMLAGGNLSLTFAGRLSQITSAVQDDGGRPDAAGYAANVVGTLSDGGTYFEYAGRHGAVIASTVQEAKQGLLFQVDNAGRSSGNHVFYVTYWGSFGQDDQIAFTNFPSASQTPLIVTSAGQYRYGYAGELAHDGRVANDETTGHWRNLHTYADAGSEWVTMLDTSLVKSGILTLSTGTKSIALHPGITTCVCGKVTNEANGVRCAVSSGTLTATGTGSDQVSYVCL